LVVARAHPDEVALPQRLAAVLTVTSELAARLAVAGATTVSGALGLHRRLVHVLEPVDADRLTAVRCMVADLDRELRAAARVLARLQEMKRGFDAVAEPPPPRNLR
jgi:hypothetical protein